jgi:hypothetical protein
MRLDRNSVLMLKDNNISAYKATAGDIKISPAVALSVVCQLLIGLTNAVLKLS